MTNSNRGISIVVRFGWWIDLYNYTYDFKSRLHLQWIVPILMWFCTWFWHFLSLAFYGASRGQLCLLLLPFSIFLLSSYSDYALLSWFLCKFTVNFVFLFVVPLQRLPLVPWYRCEFFFFFFFLFLLLLLLLVKKKRKNKNFCQSSCQNPIKFKYCFKSFLFIRQSL